MKKIILLFLLLTSYLLFSQSLYLYDFANIYKAKSIEEKKELLFKYKFRQEKDTDNSKSVFSRKKFRKDLQKFDIELVKILDNEIIYSMSNPKAYIRFKGNLEKIFERDQNEKDLVFKRKDNKSTYRIKITESDENFEDVSYNVYNFTYYDK